jgi:hypothetical protein
MGRFTDDLAQLRSNINSTREDRLSEQNARIFSVKAQISDFAATRASNGIQDAKARAAFVNNNANDVNRLVNSFHHLRQVFGRQGREERAAFINDLSKNTLDLLTSFSVDHRNAAEQDAKSRADFVSANKSSVNAYINEAAQDRAGAHAAFFGTGAAKKKTAFIA